MNKEFRVGPKVYRFSEIVGWPAHDAFNLFVDLASPLMPLVDVAFMDDREERARALVDVAPKILQAHDKRKTRELAELLFENCTVDGSKVVVGVHPGTFDEMVEVFTHCVEAQFVPFFLGSAVKRLLAMLPDPDSSPDERSAA